MEGTQQCIGGIIQYCSKNKGAAATMEEKKQKNRKKKVHTAKMFKELQD
jgi:hypothetical protein